MDIKLLLSYDIKEHRAEEYYRFIMGEFLPRVQTMGLVMAEGWQTVYGDYPARLMAFVAAEGTHLLPVIQSDEWQTLETRLDEFVENYEKMIVPIKPNFQFFIPHYRRER